MQLNDIPLFSGNESDNAVDWLHEFLLATANFHDSGIVRLLSARLAPNSPARQWFDALDANLKMSWALFEPYFRERWITAPQVDDAARQWELFQNHVLIIDDVLDNRKPITIDDIITFIDLVTEWSTQHVALGAGAKKTEEELIQATMKVIPSFIRAYIQVSLKPGPQTLTDLCSSIQNLPPSVLDLEVVRREGEIDEMRFLVQVDRRLQAMSEKVDNRLEEMSLKIDRLFEVQSRHTTAFAHANGSTEIEVPATTQKSEQNPASTEGIIWESCSPITSVASISLDSSSSVATPQAQSTTLPATSEDSTTAIQEVHDSDIDPISIAGVPTEWRKPSFVLARKEIRELALKLIDYLNLFPVIEISGVDARDGPDVLSHQCESFLTALVMQDQITGEDKNREKVVGTLLKSRKSSGGNKIEYKLLSCFRGIAMIQGYRTYEHPRLVNEAIRLWDSLAAYNVSRGHFKIITGSEDYWELSGNCNYQKTRPVTTTLHISPLNEPSLAGGILLEPLSVQISSKYTVYFMLLSAHLADLTKHVKYKEAAILSANCIKAYMLDTTAMLVKDCDINAVDLSEKTGNFSSWLTGVFIEGLSVLALITGDTSWSDLMAEIAISALRAPQWHASNGILTLGSDGDPAENTDTNALKGILIRGLLAAYRSPFSKSPLRTLIRSYINVQCNALLELARYNRSFGVNWMGPHVGPFVHAQIAALDAFIGAIGVNDC